MSSTYNFSARRGDTYPGAQFTITVNGTPLNLTGASLLCQFRKTEESAPALTLTNGSGLSIVNAQGGVIKINSQAFTVPAGTYLYDIEITMSDGSVKTYITGTVTVKESISRV